MTEEEFETYSLDLKDAGFRVSYGLANKYNIAEKWDFSFNVTSESRGKNFSLNDYSKISEDLEILCDRLEDEFDLMSITIELSKFSFDVVFYKYELVDGCFPTSEDILKNIKNQIKLRFINASNSSIDRKASFLRRQVATVPEIDDNLGGLINLYSDSIYSIRFYFDNKVYKKKVHDNGIRKMYMNMKDYDPETAAKMKSIYPDILKEHKIKRFMDI